MKDLTRGSIVSHILNMAPPIVAGMITIMICQLVDLYFVAEARRSRGRGRGGGGQCRIPHQRVHAGARRRHGCADGACRGAQGSRRRQSGLQPGDRAVGAVRPVDAGRGSLAGAALYALGGRRRGHRRGGHHISVVGHAGAGAAIRDAGDGGRAAGHRHRAADHAGAGACGHHQHRAGAGADRGLGHRPRVRRCRCGPGQLDRRPDRRADAVGVFPQVRALCRASILRSGVRSCGNGSASSMSACRPAASSRSSSSGWA